MAELHAPDAEPDSELERRWNPACWDWPLPELSHLHNAPDPLEVEEKATQALRDRQAGRCAMCEEVQSLRTDHDHKTALVRGLLCHECNILVHTEARCSDQSMTQAAELVAWEERSTPAVIIVKSGVQERVQYRRAFSRVLLGTAPLTPSPSSSRRSVRG